MRADAGYFAGQLARAALFLRGGVRHRCADVTSGDRAAAAEHSYRHRTRTWATPRRCWPRTCWPASADPRARRRRTLPPDQRTLPLNELAGLDAVHGYST